MLWTQDIFFRIVGLIVDILVTFPLAFDLFLKNPPSAGITDNSEIYTHLGGNMSRGGPPGENNYVFLKPFDVFSFQKTGAFIHPLPGKILIFFQKNGGSPIFKITSLIL